MSFRRARRLHLPKNLKPKSSELTKEVEVALTTAKVLNLWELTKLEQFKSSLIKEWSVVAPPLKSWPTSTTGNWCRTTLSSTTQPRSQPTRLVGRLPPTRSTMRTTTNNSIWKQDPWILASRKALTSLSSTIKCQNRAVRSWALILPTIILGTRLCKALDLNECFNRQKEWALTALD